jgi:hypothetical protein
VADGGVEDYGLVRLYVADGASDRVFLLRSLESREAAVIVMPPSKPRPKSKK